MNTYEAIFVARPSLNDDELGKLRDKIRGQIEKKGGTVLRAEDWGKRKLSFEIGKEKKGTYLLFNLSGDGALVKDLEHLCSVEDNLIRSLIVKADPPAPQPEVSSQPAADTAAAAPAKAQTGEGEAGGQLQ